MKVNFTFSKDLFEFAAACNVPFVYASSAAVYGASRNFTETPENERPINVYGYSKLAFDQYVRGNLSKAENTVVGLRYFNVFGARETRKGKMASMVYQLYRQLVDSGVAKLFEGTDGYENGEQRRDFVHVDDIVAINLFFAEQQKAQGIVNAGTGKSRSFNDIARTLIALLKTGRIDYIPFKKELVGKYQSFTEADLSSLRSLGYSADFLSLEEGIERTLDGYRYFDRV
jgi:ADP-L-glycero-D-manno-heptose 6-epimerase